MRRVSVFSRDTGDHARALNHLTKKRDGEVTLTAGATTTTVTAAQEITEESVILLTPTTANAASAIATTYITAARGSFTITHANNGQTDRTFRWLAAGD